MKVYSFSGTRRAQNIAMQEYGDYSYWQDMLLANGLYSGSIIPPDVPSLSIYTPGELERRLVDKYHIPDLKYF
jgi:hypothetical protein